jgi:tetratricopeptide (TPR) repeat protein
VRVNLPVAWLCALLVAAPAFAGCGGTTVIRVVDGQPIAGRYISEYAYLLYAIAADAEARGDVSMALAVYEKAENADPDSPEIWTRIGALRCKLTGTLREAGEAFRNAQALDPDYEPLFREWATCAAALKDLTVALEFASRAVDLDPERDDTVILHASILEKLGRRDEATRELDGLVAWHPVSREAWEARYTFATRQGDRAVQAHAAARLRALAPNLADRLEKDIPSLAPLAEVDLALKEGDLARARRKAKQARLPPAELAVRAAALGRLGPAREQAELLVDADPESSSARIALAVVADLAGDEAALLRALAPPPAGPLTPPSLIARLLFAELLERRAGKDAFRAWLGPLKALLPADGSDPLLIAVHRRVQARLGME